MERPPYREIEAELRRLLIERGNTSVTAQEAYRILGNDVFRLSSEQKALQIETKGGVENAWANRCRTARNNLVKAGAMRSQPHDTWTLTEAAFRSAGKSAETWGATDALQSRTVAAALRT